MGLGTNRRLPKGRGSTGLPSPFALSSRGYGILLNTTLRNSWDFRTSLNGIPKKAQEIVKFKIENFFKDNYNEIVLYFGGSDWNSDSIKKTLYLYTNQV